MATLLNRGCGEQALRLDQLPPEVQQTIFDSYADGMSLHDIMTALSQAAGGSIRTRGFFAWVRMDDARRAAWRDAQEARAEVLADEAVSIPDGAIPTSEGISKAALQSKARQWAAGKLNATRFGNQPEAPASIGVLFLAAARQINAADTGERMRLMGITDRALPPAEPMEAELVPQESRDPEPALEDLL